MARNFPQAARPVVAEHTDQNILTLFVFQRNKIELYLLCVLFPSLFIPVMIDGSQMGKHWLPVRMCVSVCVHKNEFIASTRGCTLLPTPLLHDSFIICRRQVFITKILLLLWKSIDQIWPTKVFSRLERKKTNSLEKSTQPCDVEPWGDCISSTLAADECFFFPSLSRFSEWLFFSSVNIIRLVGSAAVTAGKRVIN